MRRGNIYGRIGFVEMMAQYAHGQKSVPPAASFSDAGADDFVTDFSYYLRLFGVGKTTAQAAPLSVQRARGT